MVASAEQKDQHLQSLLGAKRMVECLIKDLVRELALEENFLENQGRISELARNLGSLFQLRSMLDDEYSFLTRGIRTL